MNSRVGKFVNPYIRPFVNSLSLVTVVIALSVEIVAQTPSGASMPAAVKTAIDQAYPGATVAKVEQVRDNNQPAFRVDSTHTGRRRVLLYAASGKLIEVAEYVQEKELPKPVADALHSHRRAIFVSATKVTRGGNVEYRITARGSRKTSMVAKPDGTVLSWQ